MLEDKRWLRGRIRGFFVMTADKQRTEHREGHRIKGLSCLWLIARICRSSHYHSPWIGHQIYFPMRTDNGAARTRDVRPAATPLRLKKLLHVASCSVRTSNYHVLASHHG